jgi:hypothetical protein
MCPAPIYTDYGNCSPKLTFSGSLKHFIPLTIFAEVWFCYAYISKAQTSCKERKDFVKLRKSTECYPENLKLMYNNCTN